MRIPLYWSKAVAQQADSRGQDRVFSCWRSSDISQDDAHESALTSARRVLQAYLSGRQLDRYAYGAAPLREEVVQRFTDAGGQLTAAVTRNSYGSLVLSTARLMFVDIDFPSPAAGAELRRLFGRLLGRQQRTAEEEFEAQALDRVRSFIARQSSWSVRVYRTRSGLRLLVTHNVFDPSAKETLEVFDALGADPLYARLCTAQGSFRARLTPKPWRCGHTQSLVCWPRETAEQQSRFEKWLTAYNGLHVSFATCRFVEALGRGTAHPEAATLVEVHDHIARATESLPLA